MSLMLVGKKFVNMKVLKLDGNNCLTQIPDVSGCPNLEDLSFLGCQNLITVHDSVGLLGKLKILDARWCYELRSFPPIKLPCLKELYLSECRSLESFPEILGKMENITELDLGCTGIYEFPFSFRNLSRLQRLSLFTMGGKFRIPSCIAMMPELTALAIHAYNGERLSPKQDEIEEIVISMGSSNAERLRLSSCEPPDDFFPLGLACFANAKELDLSFGGFTILPECIKECRLLRKLSVDECQDLREIRGIPPNLEHFSATNCRSLTSSCSSMLLNQDVHEAGNTMFFLPAARIPEWFENQIRGPSISFWFRNKFPALALCLNAGPVVECHGGQIHFDLTVIINGRENFCRSNLYHSFFIEMDHIFLIDLQKIKFDNNMDEALSGNEWNHAELSIAVSSQARISAKERAIHVFKEKSNMEDIQFIDPYKRRKLNDSLCSPDSSCKRRKLDDGLDSPDPGSMESTKISGTTSIDGLQMQLQLLKL